MRRETVATGVAYIILAVLSVSLAPALFLLGGPRYVREVYTALVAEARDGWFL